MQSIKDIISAHDLIKQAIEKKLYPQDIEIEYVRLLIVLDWILEYPQGEVFQQILNLTSIWVKFNNDKKK